METNRALLQKLEPVEFRDLRLCKDLDTTCRDQQRNPWDRASQRFLNTDSAAELNQS